jgi:hypothetical protein
MLIFRRGFFVLILLSGANTIASADEQCKGFDYVSYTVPVSVELSQMRSTIRLKMRAKSYAETIDRKKPQDSGEDKFTQFIDALRGKKLDTIIRLSSAKSDIKTIDKARKLVDTYWNAFPNMDSLKTVAQVCLGNERLFIWKLETPKGTYVNSFRFVFEPEPKFAGVSSGGAIQSIISRIYQFAQTDPKAYQVAVGETARFEFRVHPYDIWFQFNGELLGFDVFDDKVMPKVKDDSVKLYHEAFAHLRRKDIPTYVMEHTPGSKRKLDAWFGKMDAERLSEYIGTLSKRVVLFKLDAGPVDILFFADGSYGDEIKDLLNNRDAVIKLAKESPEKLRKFSIQHAYILKEGSSRKITNVSYQSFLDDLMNDRELFEYQVLYPVLFNARPEELAGLYAKS